MPAESFSGRLELLVASGQLSPETRERVEALVAKVEEAFELELTEDHGAMFVTHVAIAWEKLRRGETLPAAPDNLLDEVESYTREKEFLSKTFSELEDAIPALPHGEVAFWTAHLVAVQQSS